MKLSKYRQGRIFDFHYQTKKKKKKKHLMQHIFGTGSQLYKYKL